MVLTLQNRSDRSFCEYLILSPGVTGKPMERICPRIARHEFVYYDSANAIE